MTFIGSHTVIADLESKYVDYVVEDVSEVYKSAIVLRNSSVFVLQTSVRRKCHSIMTGIETSLFGWVVSNIALNDKHIEEGTYML